MNFSAYLTALSLVSSLFLFSCSKQKPADGAATFLVQKVSVSSSQEVGSSEMWKDITEKRVMNFNACVRDLLVNASVQFEKFQISGGYGDAVEATTDQNGCFVWSESIPFNFFSNEHYVSEYRSIKAIGTYKGTANLELLINPWKGVILDPRYDSIPDYSVKTRTESFAMASGIADNVKIDSASITVVDSKTDKDVTTVKIQLNINTPKVVRNNLINQRDSIALKTGRFKAMMALVEQRRDSATNDIVPLAFAEGVQSIDKFNLVFITEFKLDRLPNNNSTIQLAFRLDPDKGSNPPAGLGFEEGVVTLGQGGNPLRTGNSGNFLSYINIPIKDYVMKDATKANLYPETNPQRQMGFYINTVNVSKGAVENAYDASPTRKVRLNTTVCINDSATNMPISETEFFLQMVPVEKVTTDTTKGEWVKGIPYQSGCFSFQASYEYYMFDIQRFIPFKVRVKSNNQIYTNVIRDRDVYINPWGDFLTFFQDGQNLSSPVEGEHVLKQPEFFVDSISYSFLENKRDGFEIDKYMQMKLTKSFQLSFRPKVRQYINFSGDTSFATYNNGKMRVKAYVIVPRDGGAVQYEDINIKNYRLVSTADVSTTMIADQFLDTLNFKLNFGDLPRSVIRSLIILNVSAPGTKIEAKTFVYPFDMTTSGAGFNYMRFGLNSRTDYSPEDPIQSRLVEEDIQKNLQALVAQKAKDEAIVTDVKPVVLFQQRILANAKLKQALGFPPKLTIGDSNTFANDYNLAIEPKWFDNAVSNNRFTKTTLKEFCKLMLKSPASGVTLNTNEQTRWSACQTNPELFLTADATKHIVKITDQARKLEAFDLGFSTGQSSGFSVSFGISRSQSVSASGSFGIGLGFGEGIPLLEKLGPKFGGSISISTSQSTSQGSSQSSGMSNGISRGVGIDYLSLGFAADVVNCVLIKGVKYVGAGGSMEPDKLYHVCNKNVEHENLSEAWYFVGFTETPDRVLRDGMDLSDNPFVQVIRGRRMFESFKDKVFKKDVVLYLENVKPEVIEKKYTDLVNSGETKMPLNLYLDNNFPGMLDPAATIR